jgi:hypothetical protein
VGIVGWGFVVVCFVLLLLLGSLDTDNDEEWAITLNVAGQKKCLVFYTDNTMPFASPIDPNRPLWEAEFSASAGQTFRLGFEAWEKQAGGPICVLENGDNRNNYLRWEEPLTNLSQLAPNEQRAFSASRVFTQAIYPCSVTIIGSVARKPSVRILPPPPPTTIPSLYKIHLSIFLPTQLCISDPSGVTQHDMTAHITSTHSRAPRVSSTRPSRWCRGASRL